MAQWVKAFASWASSLLNVSTMPARGRWMGGSWEFPGQLASVAFVPGIVPILNQLQWKENGALLWPLYAQAECIPRIHVPHTKRKFYDLGNSSWQKSSIVNYIIKTPLTRYSMPDFPYYLWNVLPGSHVQTDISHIIYIHINHSSN